MKLINFWSLACVLKPLSSQEISIKFAATITASYNIPVHFILSTPSNLSETPEKIAIFRALEISVSSAPSKFLDPEKLVIFQVLRTKVLYDLTTAVCFIYIYHLYHLFIVCFSHTKEFPFFFKDSKSSMMLGTSRQNMLLRSLSN